MYLRNFNFGIVFNHILKSCTLKIVFIVLTGAEICYCGNQAGEKNSEIINNFIENTLESIIQKAPEFFEKGIVIKSDLSYNNRLGFFIENSISRNLLDKGYEVFLARSGDTQLLSMEHTRLEFDVNHYRLNFTEIPGKNVIKRNLSIEIVIKLIELKTRKLLFTDTFKKDYGDEVTADEKKIIESEKLPDTITGDGKNKFRKFIEPFAVSFISGIIVYLFFSMRSR